MTYLAELGLAAGKTHSSSLEDDEAEKVRAHFERGSRPASHASSPASRAPAGHCAQDRSLAYLQARRRAEGHSGQEAGRRSRGAPEPCAGAARGRAGRSRSQAGSAAGRGCRAAGRSAGSPGTAQDCSPAALCAAHYRPAAGSAGHCLPPARRPGGRQGSRRRCCRAASGGRRGAASGSRGGQAACSPALLREAQPHAGEADAAAIKPRRRPCGRLQLRGGAVPQPGTPQRPPAAAAAAAPLPRPAAPVEACCARIAGAGCRRSTPNCRPLRLPRTARAQGTRTPHRRTPALPARRMVMPQTGPRPVYKAPPWLPPPRPAPEPPPAASSAASRSSTAAGPRAALAAIRSAPRRRSRAGPVPRRPAPQASHPHYAWRLRRPGGPGSSRRTARFWRAARLWSAPSRGFGGTSRSRRRSAHRRGAAPAARPIPRPRRTPSSIPRPKKAR